MELRHNFDRILHSPWTSIVIGMVWIFSGMALTIALDRNMARGNPVGTMWLLCMVTILLVVGMVYIFRPIMKRIVERTIEDYLIPTDGDEE